MQDQTPVKPLSAILQVNDSDVAIFVGKDWEKFEPTWRTLKYKEQPKGVFSLKNTNWLALLAAPVWFAYRKMFLSLLAYMAFVYGFETILDQLFHQGLPGVVYAVVAMQLSRMLYFYVNAPRVLEIRQSGTNEESIKQALAKAGGVSELALGIGLLIVALFIVLIFSGMAKTPGEDMHNIIDNLQKEQLENSQQDGQPTDGSISTDNPAIPKK